MREFKATHSITVSYGLGSESTAVMVDPTGPNGAGPAYTEAEWNACARADWERQDDGSFTFQGRSAPDAAVSVKVRERT